MGAACGARIRRRRQELGMTQLDLARRGANGHFDGRKAKMGSERMEEELAKLSNESVREAIRLSLENRSDPKKA